MSGTFTFPALHIGQLAQGRVSRLVAVHRVESWFNFSRQCFTKKAWVLSKLDNPPAFREVSQLLLKIKVMWRCCRGIKGTVTSFTLSSAHTWVHLVLNAKV